MTSAAFTPAEFGWSVLAALLVELGLAGLFITAEGRNANIQAEPLEVPIAVRPTIDDLPLLKKGGKRVKYKLPDMWRKQAPVKRQEAKSAPTPKASKTPERLPTSPVQKSDDPDPPPAPEDEVIKQADDDIPEPEKPVETTSNEEGAADGIEEGTEADPLKARAISQYKLTLIRWFDKFFSVPPGAIPCEELKTLSARALATVGGDRTVVSYSLTGPTGNSTFDGLVEKALQTAVGKTLPPPPDKYPEILSSSIPLSYSRKNQPCE